MSAFGMKPSFTNKTEYLDWIRGWKILYADVSEHIRKQKLLFKDIQRSGDASAIKVAQEKLIQERAMGAKAMTLRSEADIRWANIRAMEKSIAEQRATFPLVVENVRNIDFHFNKKHLEFPEIVPMWILKAKGTSYYLNHIDCSTPWTTRETPDNPSTKGAIRIKRGNVSISADGTATIS